MLFKERKRLAELAAAEALGESLWTEDLDQAVRGKLLHAWYDSTTNPYAGRAAAEQIERLVSRNNGWTETFKIEDALMKAPVDDVLTYVEAISLVLSARAANNYEGEYQPSAFIRYVNAAFNAHRVAYRLADLEIVPLSSDELHVEVVEPVLGLLHGRPDLRNAHDAYLNALKEISRNDPADAITDAGTALQETLTALGCKGSALGPLIADAKKNGLLAGHNRNLTDGVEKFLHWASADRSQSGDAHTSQQAALSDAWLMVHIVGALIVRLADVTPRAEPLA